MPVRSACATIRSRSTRSSATSRPSHRARSRAPYGVTANAIATGPFDTELSREYRGSSTGVKTTDWYKAMMPIGRWGRPDEMGALVAFLCSTRASYVTGETIRIDGGYTKSLF